MAENKQPTKATIKLNGDGLIGIVDTVEKRAAEAVGRCRNNPGDKACLKNFNKAFDDLVEVLTAAEQHPVDGYPDCFFSLSYHNVGRTVAYAEVSGIKVPKAFRQMVNGQDLAFPLEFLIEIEKLRLSYPDLRFELKKQHNDNEFDIPF